MARPPFDMLRAAFLLLAAMIIAELLVTSYAGIACFLMIQAGQIQLGACKSVGEQIKESWSEMLSAILALLLAAQRRNGGPPPPDDPNHPTDGSRQ